MWHYFRLAQVVACVKITFHNLYFLQEDLIDVMPAVEEANSISEELDKRVKFEIILISPQMIGKMQGTKGSKAEVKIIFYKLICKSSLIYSFI